MIRTTVAILLLLLYAHTTCIAQSLTKEQVLEEAKAVDNAMNMVLKMLPKGNKNIPTFSTEIKAIHTEYLKEANATPPDDARLEQLRKRVQEVSEKLGQEAATSLSIPPQVPGATSPGTKPNTPVKVPGTQTIGGSHVVRKSGNVDTTVAFNATSFAAYCNTWKTKWKAKMMRPDELQKLHLLPKVATMEPRRTNQLLDESSAGAMMVAGKEFANLGVYLIFDAGAQLPEHAITINNVGGLLRMMDAIPEALKVLLYANSINRESEIILVQIGNCLLEYGDDKKAEVFFRRCLRIDEDYPPAHKGMAAIYLKRGKFGDAYEEILRGATVGFNLDVAKSAGDAQQGCGFGMDDEEGYSGPQFPYEKVKEAISKASKYISVSSATVVQQNKMSIPQFPPFDGPTDYCSSGPTLAIKLLNETIENDQKFIAQVKGQRPGNENEMYALEDFMFSSINDVYNGLSKKIDKEYRKEKFLLEERVIQEMKQYNEEWTSKNKDCNAKCGAASDDKCFKNCMCTALMDKWHDHQNKIKGLYQQWKSLTINLGSDLQKLQNDYYESTSSWMDRVYDKPMYQRMDLTRAGFSNSLVRTFVTGLNFTSYFCELEGSNMDIFCAGGYSQFSPKDMELDKPDKNKAPECPKDKNVQLNIMKMVSVSLECDAVGVEYFNTKIPVSNWAAAKYNWKKSQLTTIAGVGTSVGGGGFTASGSARIGVISTWDIKTNDLDFGVVGKLDYSNDAMLANSKTGYTMEAKAMIFAGTETSVSKTMTYGNDGLSVKYASKSKTPSWDQIIK